MKQYLLIIALILTMGLAACNTSEKESTSISTNKDVAIPAWQQESINHLILVDKKTNKTMELYDDTLLPNKSDGSRTSFHDFTTYFRQGNILSTNNEDEVLGELTIGLAGGEEEKIAIYLDEEQQYLILKDLQTNTLYNYTGDAASNLYVLLLMLFMNAS